VNGYEKCVITTVGDYPWKEENSNTCNNMDELLVYHLKLNNPITKGQILYTSVIWGPILVKFLKLESRMVVTIGWEKGEIVVI
jgi:hypothetical protein